jgi:hypothetical protein
LSFAGKVICQELGEVDAAPVRELIKLGTAGESVGEHHGVCLRRPDRWQQRLLSDGDGYLVVTLLDSEVSGKTAAPTDHAQRGTGLGQSCLIRVESHHGVLVTMRLGERLDARQ